MTEEEACLRLKAVLDRQQKGTALNVAKGLHLGRSLVVVEHWE
jgi:hypothetical protein